MHPPSLTQLTRFDAFLFSLKTALAAVLALLVYEGLHFPGSAWAAAVSAALISQPTLQPSFQASLYRFWANLIGAATGSLMVTVIPLQWLALLLGVLVVGLIVHQLRLDDSLRPAFASVVIVILTSKGSVWWGSLDRVLAVMVGCGIALAVGFVFDRILVRYVERVRHHGPPRPAQE